VNLRNSLGIVEITCWPIPLLCRHVWALAPWSNSSQGEVPQTCGVLCPTTQPGPSPATRHADAEYWCHSRDSK